MPPPTLSLIEDFGGLGRDRQNCSDDPSSRMTKYEIKTEEIQLEDTFNLQLEWDYISEIQFKLGQSLPQYWILVAEKDRVNVLLLSRDAEKTTQRRVSASFVGDVDVSVHRLKPCKEICQEVLANINIDPLRPDTVDSFVSSVLQVVNNLRKYEVCIGCTMEDYKCFWKSERNGSIDHNPYGEVRYNQTLRSKQCQLLILPNKLRCMKCYNLSRLLRRKILSHGAGFKLHTPNIHLTEMEKIKKIESVMKQLDCKRKIISKLRKKVQET